MTNPNLQTIDVGCPYCKEEKEVRADYEFATTVKETTCKSCGLRARHVMTPSHREIEPGVTLTVWSTKSVGVERELHAAFDRLAKSKEVK